MSGNTTQTGLQAGQAQLWRASLLAAIWIAFLVGALSAGIATPYFNTWTPLFPAGILLAAAPLNDADH